VVAWWRGGVGFLAVAGWKLVEEEAVAGDEGGFVFGGTCGGVGEVGGVLDAEAHFRKGEVGTAAGTGDEALHLGEGFDLLLSHLPDFANGTALGDAAIFNELDLGLEERGEDDVRLACDGIFLREAAGNGGAGDRIDESAVEEFCITGFVGDCTGWDVDGVWGIPDASGAGAAGSLFGIVNFRR
jgi:hypothetical protein